ncbi:guanylate cyclase domain-containing protein [Haematococcus lacustris]|uniref:Guanylate cyclase domain-containing protein n=1 Tax=Haematococcus lacustris TaxID=44745 RepID=A0A699YSA0_HAELA|nr:guanylate cyclase domain-containing protein [Haematococcus lacustris]
MGGPDCTAPSSLWASKLGVGMVLPARQSSKSALLWQLHSRSLSQASGRSQKKGTVQEPGPVANGTSQPAAELGQGLLSLLASRPWQQQQTSLMASSSSIQGSDATDASLHQGHARPGLVAWQRLCDLYREVEVEEPAALTVLAGLRVRVGMHTGLAADEVLVQSRIGASSTTYGGAALVLAKAVQACAHGGQIALSAATFVKVGQPPSEPAAWAAECAVGCTRHEPAGSLSNLLCWPWAVQLPVEELRAAGMSVVHMGKHLLDLGEGKGDTALDLYCATLDTPAHAHRLWALGPLRTTRQLQPGVLQAPYGVTATVFMSVVGLAQLKAWDASLAKECLALYQATAQRVLLHVAGRQLPAGYLVSTADEDGMVLAAFSSSLQCLHWALLTLTTCMDLDWPQALLDSLLAATPSAPATLCASCVACASRPGWMWVRWPVTSRQPTAASTTGAAALTGPPASMAWQHQGRCGAPRRHGTMHRPAASHHKCLIQRRWRPHPPLPSCPPALPAGQSRLGRKTAP